MLKKNNLIQAGKAGFQTSTHHVNEVLVLLGCYTVC